MSNHRDTEVYQDQNSIYPASRTFVQGSECSATSHKYYLFKKSLRSFIFYAPVNGIHSRPPPPPPTTHHSLSPPPGDGPGTAGLISFLNVSRSAV